MSRGGAGREGSSPWGLGVAGGEVFQTSSRGRAGQRRHVGEEQGTNLEEQGRSRTGGRRSRTSGGRLGDEQQSRGREWRSRGREWRSREVAALPSILPRLRFVAARAPGRAGNSPALRFGAINWPRSRPPMRRPAPTPRRLAPPSAWKRDYGHSRGDGLRLAPNRA